MSMLACVNLCHGIFVEQVEFAECVDRWVALTTRRAVVVFHIVTASYLECDFMDSVV